MALDTDKIRKETVAHMKEMFEGKIEGQQKEAMLQGIDEVLNELDTLSKKHAANPSISLADLLSHLPQERIDLIRHSFDIHTFYPSVDKERKTCAFLKEGNVVWPTISLDSSHGLREANITTIASILVECIIFIVRVVGYTPPQNAIAAAVDVATNWLRNETNIDLKSIVETMKQAVLHKEFARLAHLILKLITTMFSAAKSIFLKIVKTMMSNMGPFDYLKFIAKLVAFIVTIIRTGGAAFVARIVALASESSGFLQKFVDITV